MPHRKRPGHTPSLPTPPADQWERTVRLLGELQRSDTAMAVLRVIHAYDTLDQAAPRDQLEAAVAVSDYSLGGALNLLRKLGLIVFSGESAYRLGNPIGLPVLVLGEVS